jgi:hypothetical protein
MYYTFWSYEIWGAVVLCAGLFAVWRGWRLWHRPESLKQGSWTHRVHDAWLRSWLLWIGRREDHPRQLSTKQIRSLAAMNAVAGVCLVLAGIIAVLLG